MTSLSVLVPVYNEQHLVAASLARLEVLATSPRLSRVQVIVVDDCSKDSTPEVLRKFEREHAGRVPKLEWLFLRHERNSGKGQAIRTALARAECELTVIHDADLEYHPVDLVKIVEVFEEERADAVFGSRFAGSQVRRVLFFRHELGNRLLTFLTNLVTDLNVTDMETCYKAVRTDLLKSIPLVSNDFRLEPELTIKLARRGARLFEVPIRYSGRTYQEGKKIGWRDGVRALAAIARFSVTSDLYVADDHRSETLARLARAPRFHRWTGDVLRPWIGQRVLELGSGVGDVTRQLVPRERYVACEANPVCLRSLKALEADRPYLTTGFCDVTRPESLPRDSFDTVLAVNLLQRVPDDVQALRNMASVLAPGGRIVALVPQLASLQGSLDEKLGHVRRYDEQSLRAAAGAAGLRVRELFPFNRVGAAAWWLNGKVLKRGHFGAGQVSALEALTPALRRVDARLPLPALSLVAVLERDAEAGYAFATPAPPMARITDAASAVTRSRRRSTRSSDRIA